MTAPASTDPIAVLRATMKDFDERYAYNSRLFVREVFNAEPELWQDMVLDKYDKGEKRISIRSGHGVGKTTLLAWLMVHHLLFRFPQKTVVTAPTSNQLWDALWAEFHKWLNRLPPELFVLLEIKAERVELKEAPKESFVTARTSRAEQPEALAGVHEDHVLLIADEASGIPDPVFEAASGSMSTPSAITILAGNPVRSTGFFHDTHTKLADIWFTLRVPCSASTRVDPNYVKEMGERYGVESNAYRVRVLGEFPLADDDTVIPRELLTSAMMRDVKPITSHAPIWGVDPAHTGADRSALAKRRANVLMEVKFWSGLDTMQLAGRIKIEWDATPEKDRPSVICVDSIGIGAGVADRLKELGLPVRSVNVSENAAIKEQYTRLRSELWFAMRVWFARRDVRLPNDEDLVEELATPRFQITPAGKIQVEDKKKIKASGRLRGRSPDLAEALMMTFAGEATALLHGRTRDWKKPLKRNIRGIV